MGLTVTQQAFQMARGEDDGIRIGLTQVTLDSSYPTNGEAIAASDIDSGLHNILGLVPVAYNAAAAPYFVHYDSENGKIEVYDYDSEVADTTDLSALVITFLYICN